MTFKKITIIIMALFYVGVGSMHFLNPKPFLIITPSYLPFRLELVYISGFLEILFGLLLCSQKYRKIAGYGLIILLVFPANIHLYLDETTRLAYGSKSKNDALIRMFFQPLLIIMAYWHSHNRQTNSPLLIIISIITIFYFTIIVL